MKSSISDTDQQDDRKRFAARKGAFLKAIRADLTLQITSKLVAHSLLDHLNFGDAYVFPSITTIAKETGISETSARRGVKDLQSGGWLVVSPRWSPNGDRTSSEFRPVWERMNRETDPREPDVVDTPDAPEVPVQPEFVWTSGVMKFKQEHLDILEARLHKRLPAFLEMIERDGSDWTEETWKPELKSRLDEWSKVSTSEVVSN